MSFWATLFSSQVYPIACFIELAASISEQLNLCAISEFHKFKLQNNNLTIWPLLFVVYSQLPTKLKFLLSSTVFHLSFELHPLLTHFFIYFMASFKATKKDFVYFLAKPYKVLNWMQ